MLGEKGTVLVEAKTAAAARSGLTFESFKASAVLMQGAGAVTGTANAKEFDVVNLQDSDVATGDYILVTKTIQGFFVTVSAPTSNGGSSGMIEFEFDEDDYSPGVPADCASRTSGEYNLRVKVVTPPCNGSVLGMDEEGYVTVSDPGEFLKDRDPADLPGRRGFAMLLSGEPEYEYGDATCIWVITWINFFRQVSMVHNIIFREMGITVKRKKITVWDECDLPDEEIEGVDCEDEEYV